MMGIGFDPQGMMPFGTSSSQDDRSSGTFEELAMPLFDSLYNFARWLVHNQNDAEDLEFLGVGIIALTGHLGGFLSGVNGPG